MCDGCTWHHKTFLVQLYWHLAVKLYYIVYCVQVWWKTNSLKCESHVVSSVKVIQYQVWKSYSIQSESHTQCESHTVSNVVKVIRYPVWWQSYSIHCGDSHTVSSVVSVIQYPVLWQSYSIQCGDNHTISSVVTVIQYPVWWQSYNIQCESHALMGAKRIIPRQLSLTDNDCSWQIFVYDRKNWELNPINREGKKQSVICSIWSQILIDWGVPSLISLMVSVDVKHHVYLLRLGRGAYKCAEHGLCPFPLTHLFLKDTVRGSGLRGDNSSSLHTRSIARSSLSSAPVTAVMKSFSHDANSSSLFRVCQLFVGSIALQSKQPAVRKSVRLQNWSMCTPLIQKGQVQNVCQSRVPHYGNTKIAQRAHKAYEQSLSVSGE